MPKKIQDDHQRFRDIISGKFRDGLKKFIQTGRIFRMRGKNGKMSFTVPYIDLPHIVHGQQDEGVNRGPGKPGDVIGRKPGKGKEGNKPGQEPSEGIDISVDLEDVLKFLKDELELPNLRQKETETFEEVRLRYTGLSKVGPQSLLHKRRTMRECLKRQAASGMEEFQFVPDCADPVPVFNIINEDKRYRQWREYRVPKSNAMIFFARDGSGSMDEKKCNIVSDMCWWIDNWIQHFYEHTERAYVWHDTAAKEVSERKFYSHRYGGGTICSKSLDFIDDAIKFRYPAQRWNIFIFYFSDGENSHNDNAIFCKKIKENLTPDKVNLIGITQILPWDFQSSLAKYVHGKVENGYLDKSQVRLAYVPDSQKEGRTNPFDISEDQLNESMLQGIKALLGSTANNKQSLAS